MKKRINNFISYLLDPILILFVCVFVLLGYAFSLMYVSYKSHSSAMNYSECVSKHVDLTLYRGLSLDKKYDIIQKHKCKVNK